MIHRPVTTLVPSMLVAAVLVLAACGPKPAAAPRAVGCTADEMRTRHARTAACRAEFQAMLERAEAERRRASALPQVAPAPARDQF
jgi:hypothetical protein